MNTRTMLPRWSLLSLALLPLVTAAEKTDDVPLGEVVERQLVDEPFTQWVKDPERIASQEGDVLETRETIAEGVETVKLSNLVAPIRFASGVAQIPDSTVKALAEILEQMRDRNNVRLHLVGHADNRPLSPALAEVFSDNQGLSKERAGHVAEHFQTELGLPAQAISYEWAGDTRPVASNSSERGRALNRRVEVEVWYDESVDQPTLEEVLVPHKIQRVKVCRMETVCKLRYLEGHVHRARIKNLVAPLRYESESIEISAEFVETIRQTFDNLSDKQNVVVKFVGFTDDLPLAGRMERIYGNHEGLSKARAQRVALAVQDALELPTARIDSEGSGATRPLASNATAQGRRLNRRVEVEFWYDDPLQELPDEPQLCPEEAGADVVTLIYDPPWGSIPPVDIVDGQPAVPPGYTADLSRALAEIADKANPRLRFVGYTRNERLQRRTAAAYGDDIGLSASRARRTMEQVAAELSLDPSQVEFEGRGYVHADDVVNAGFIQGETSHVAVQAVYDELAILDDYEGVEITRITHELNPENPLGLNLMRITVDGEPIDDPQRSSSDIQRCTDVAFDDANIEFGFDNLSSAPRLSVTAKPDQTVVSEEEIVDPAPPPITIGYPLEDEPHYITVKRATRLHFRMYTNYSHFIERAEIRVFEAGRSLESEPLDVIDIDFDGVATWKPRVDEFKAPVEELVYVLRAYGRGGNFDETNPQPLWVVYATGKDGDEGVTPVEPEADPELFAAYGENGLAQHNIRLSSGTVTVRGDGLSQEQEVWVAGRPIPVDETGSFVTEEILPNGAHTVEVAVVDQQGSGELYLRDLEFETNDWFYVGMADLTLSTNDINGPGELLQGDNAPQDITSNADGRLAFFVNGKFGDHWNLSASADTREGPVEDLFSNFMDKSPESLLRRIDPDYYYPTFGDDSTVEEMAPTQGKFFVRLSRNDNFGQWGNFKIGYMNNELAQVDRGLYGANLHFQSQQTTDFGDHRFAMDTFAAEPGTIASREEFRGTGGSLYFLSRQDILSGSERVRIEIRDKASGIVTGVRNLTPVLDYDIDYLQGRIVLTEPLASTADDNLLIRTNALNGDAAYLVVRYEYTPGFDELDAVSVGGQAHYWLGDYVKLGLTSNNNEQEGSDNSLNGADLTLRLGAGSWLKLQQGESEGLVSLPQLSTDGGFEFQSYDPLSFLNAKASANRADIALSSRELIKRGDVQLTAYTQDVEAGYSGPGLTAIRDTRNYGGTLNLPFLERFAIGAKVDNLVQDESIETRSQEFSFGYQINQHWGIDAGYRTDERIDRGPIVFLTQEQGERADAVLQLGYDSKSTWSGYAFVQETLSTTGDRLENSRAGLATSYRVTERLQLNAEVSDGDLGVGGRIGSNYLHSDRTSMYVNYVLENERTDNGLRSGRGREGNMVAGVKSRLADSASVFLEERYQHNTAMTGLTHATGISFAPTQKWNLGFNTDLGTLRDEQTGAETERVAGGVQLGFGSDKLQLSTAVEYRSDDVEQLDLSRTDRETWLFRNNFKYQITPGSRLLGKLNRSDSTSSLGDFFGGGFTEAVVGYALRPVEHDRYNALVKYTYFYNLPTTDQLTLQDVASEFIQKSHVASVDMDFQLTRRFSVGGKYAYRLGLVSLDREDPEFFDNDASLYVLRGDYRVGKHWKLTAEGRTLEMSDLNERRTGALLSISRQVGDHMSMGVGYNFTDFSDDLTDLSFDHHGTFFNVTGFF